MPTHGKGVSLPRLLIVDDEEDVREFAANFFRRRSIEARAVASGEDALAAIAAWPCKLVMLDIKMPGIDGLETLRRLKEVDASIQVVMVTGRKPEEENVADQCRALGAMAYIHKPLELEELEKVIMRQLFEQSRGQIPLPHVD
jgi:DNA-binding response OmpR family regulator